MITRKTSIKTKTTDNEEKEGFYAKPLREVSQVIPVDGGGDVYLVQGNKKFQLRARKSEIYDVEEWVFKGTLIQGQEIRFSHKDGRNIPIRESSNCGYTLVGIAKKNFEAKHALIARGETTDDQVYIYTNKNSTLFYIGETGEKELFIRIYDNLSGIDNDRWVVVSRK